jgi:hypothetical protein
MSLIRVSVSVDNASLESIDRIAEQLQFSGMKIEQTLSSIGVINGLIDSELIDNLSEIEGVQQVEIQQDFQLPSPNSEVQ